MSDQGTKTCPLQDGAYCTKGKCGWWNYLEEECSIATLGTLAIIKIAEAED